MDGGQILKTPGKMWMVCIATVATIICGFLAWSHSASLAWISAVTQSEKSTILYAQNSLSFLVNKANEHLNVIVQDSSGSVGREPQEVIDRLETSLGDSYLYACVYKDDGTLIASKGTNSPDTFPQSYFFESLLYSDGNALSEINYDNGVLHLQTASLLEDGSIVLVGQDVVVDYVKKLKAMIGREYWLFYGNEEQFVPVMIPSVSEPSFSDSEKEIYRRLFKTTTDSQRPSSEVLPYQGKKAIKTATPLYDAEHWDVKGFLVQVTPDTYWKYGNQRIAQFIWIGALLSCIVAVFFLMRIYNKKRTDASIRMKKIYLVYSMMSFITVVIFVSYGTFGFLPALLRDYETSSVLTNSRALAYDIEEGFKPEISTASSLVENVKKVTGDDYRIFATEVTSQPSTFTTLSSRLSRLVSPLRFSGYSNGIEVGKTTIDRIGYTYGKFAAHGIEWQVFHEDTFVSNEILSVQFFGTILLIASLVIALVFGLVTYHLQDRLLLKNAFLGYLFLAPALIHLIWWAAGPLGFSLFLAFRRWSVVDPAKPFVGFDNFIELFQDGNFWNALKNTLVYSLYVPIGMMFSLLLAMAVNKAGKIAIALRVLYYLPVVTAGVATTIVWKWIFNRDFGVFNYILGWLGISKVPWLDSPQFALISIMIMSIWQAIGSQLLIFLAGLQGIPIDFYDAAKVDGAGKFSIFRHITVPLLKPTTLFVLVTSIIGSFQVFTPVYVLTQGGPLRSTDVVFYHIWKAAWSEMRMGYAAAQSWILFLLLMILTYFEFKLYGKDSWQAYF